MFTLLSLCYPVTWPSKFHKRRNLKGQVGDVTSYQRKGLNELIESEGFRIDKSSTKGLPKGQMIARATDHNQSCS